MHSSPLLFASEFRATRRRDAALPLGEAFADYHSQDRVAVVANSWERSFVENAAGVTALTALFYDAQRATGKEFYIYPSHYLLVCQGPAGVMTDRGPRPLTTAAAGRPWGSVDLWPETQWLDVPSDTTSLLRTIFAQHIHRLFWPEDLPIVPAGDLLPGYMRLIIASRLKAVYFYNTATPDLQIEASPKARKLLEESPRLFSASFPPPTASRYRTVEPDDFMRLVGACFEKTAPPKED